MTLTERAAAAAELKTTGQCNCTQSVVKVFEDKLPVEGDTLRMLAAGYAAGTVSYTHLRAHETRHDLVCRLLLEKKKAL